MGALGIGGRLRAFEGEHLFVESDGRGVRPDTEMIAERLAEPLEAADRLSTLSGIEMDADERARCLLVGGVLFGQPIPQRCGAQHVDVPTAQACARLDRPGLVEVIGEEVARDTDRRPHGSRPRRTHPSPDRAAASKRSTSVSTPPSGCSTSTPRSFTIACSSPSARLAKCRAFRRFEPEASGSLSGQSASMTCARCIRWSGASASSFTTSAARRLRHASPEIGAASTATENRPRSWIASVRTQAIVRGCPGPGQTALRNGCGTVASLAWATKGGETDDAVHGRAQQPS